VGHCLTRGKKSEKGPVRFLPDMTGTRTGDEKILWKKGGKKKREKPGVSSCWSGCSEREKNGAHSAIVV